MPLIPSDRPSRRDLEIWAMRERADAIHARTSGFLRRLERAEREVRAFLAEGPAYVSTSWGKDSVCVAWIARMLDSSVPLVWVTIDGETNPDCHLVRDAFLRLCPGAYLEVNVTRKTVSGKHGTLIEGAIIAAADLGTDRYISGVRAQESSSRRMSAAIHGHSTARTCRPILDWTGDDVFAYLHTRGLPVHPVYACSLDGAVPRDRLRVGPLGGDRGTEWGRTEHERTYYRAEIEALRRHQETP